MIGFRNISPSPRSLLACFPSVFSSPPISLRATRLLPVCPFYRRVVRPSPTFFVPSISFCVPLRSCAVLLFFPPSFRFPFCRDSSNWPSIAGCLSPFLISRCLKASLTPSPVCYLRWTSTVLLGRYFPALRLLDYQVVVSWVLYNRKTTFLFGNFYKLRNHQLQGHD